MKTKAYTLYTRSHKIKKYIHWCSIVPNNIYIDIYIYIYSKRKKEPAAAYIFSSAQRNHKKSRAMGRSRDATDASIVPEQGSQGG